MATTGLGFAPLKVVGEDGIPIADKLLYVRPDWGGAEVRFRLDERGATHLGWEAATVVPAGNHRVFVRDYRDSLPSHDAPGKCFLVVKAGEAAARIAADAAPGWALMTDIAGAGLEKKLLDNAEKAAAGDEK